MDAGEGVGFHFVGQEDLGHAVKFDQGGMCGGHVGGEEQGGWLLTRGRARRLQEFSPPGRARRPRGR